MLSLHKVDRQQWIKFFTHLIVICMLFFLPDMMMNYASPHHNDYWVKIMYFKSAFYVGFFYINYYLIIGHTLFGKRQNYLKFVLWNLLLIVVFVIIFYFVNDQVAPMGGRMKPKKMHDMPHYIVLIRNWSFILRDLAMVVLTIALSVALKFAERLSAISKRHDKLLASQREEELDNLKSQLNPHFLFNTLNTIYSLIDISPKEAQNAIHQLSKLLRHMLYESSLVEKLSKEIDFTQTYISLMEMRLGEGAVKVDFSCVKKDVDIAPLIFVTLIENAFKHGNTGISGQPIEISISSDANGVVECRTFNHFVAKSSTSGSKSGGIGLVNLRRRLLLLYGDKAKLSTQVSGDTYTAVLTIDTSSAQSA